MAAKFHGPSAFGCATLGVSSIEGPKSILFWNGIRLIRAGGRGSKKHPAHTSAKRAGSRSDARNVMLWPRGVADLCGGAA